MHDAAPSLIHRHRARAFNPGSNAEQVSSLRLVNPGEEDAAAVLAFPGFFRVSWAETQPLPVLDATEIPAFLPYVGCQFGIIRRPE